jgi:iduronate 2-sulfatase
MVTVLGSQWQRCCRIILVVLLYGCYCLCADALGGLTLVPSTPTAAAAATVAGTKKPNILFIIVDDLNMELGIYGSKIVKSPNMDQLARSGAVFNRAYCQISNCSPSRSSFLTGTRPDVNRVFDLDDHFRDRLPNIVTLPQHFKNNGYFTQAYGKVFHYGVNDPISWSIPWYEPTVPVHANKDLAILKTGFIKRRPAQNISAWECGDVSDDYYRDGNTTNMAISALKWHAKMNASRPFFMAVGYHRPHLPFITPKKYCDMYKLTEIEDPLSGNIVQGSVLGRAPMLEIESYQGVPSRPHRITDHFARLYKRAYYACISYVDALIGKLIGTLDALNLRKHTYIVLVSDNSYTLGDFGHWGKHTNYESDVRVPFMVSGPGISSSLSISSIVELLDIFPTVAELAGIPSVSTAVGKSLVPMLRNQMTTFKEMDKVIGISQFPRQDCIMGYTMRTDKFRLVLWFQMPNRRLLDLELFGLFSNFTERVNVGFDRDSTSLLNTLLKLWNFLPQVPNVVIANLTQNVKAIRDTEDLGNYCLNYFVPK